MPDWQERITRETKPALRAEHDLRYRLAAPLVHAARTWVDLGCGNGVAAADALGGGTTGRAVLVDVSADAVEAAAAELASGGDVVPLVADLTDADALASVRAAILEGEQDRVITCFENIEHLSNFVPLVTLLSELAEAGEATVVLSVPNDAFWAIENPHHLTMWSSGSFEELRGLLPAGVRVARQVELRGSAIVPGDDDLSLDLSVSVSPSVAVPTHFVAAFGPRASELVPHAEATQHDLDESRRWEREREADLAYFQELVTTWRPWFEEWRKYIHDLEGRLDLPPSGVSPDELPPGS
jgi:SAM-dependent methyltransferase